MAIDSLHCNDRVQELTHSAWAQLFSNWWSSWWSLQLFSKFPKVWVLQWCRHSFPMFPVCSRSIVADSRCPAKPRHVETCPEDMQRHALKARLQQQDIIIDIIRMCLLLLLVMFILKYSMILNVYSARILLGFCSACFGRLSLLLIHCGPGKVCKGFFVLWRLNLPSLLGVGYLALASMSAELEP